MRSTARALLLVLALARFLVAVIGMQASSSGRPVLTWLAAGLTLVMAAPLVRA
jgi:hypothetical protein